MWGFSFITMRPYFIVNPIAGGGAAAEKFEKVRRFLEERQVDHGFVLTERAGESSSLAEEAYKNGERFIVAVGGDGTVNEVASALYTKPGVIMGICPFGTGNDFARVLSLPTEPEQAAEALISGSPRPVDVGLADGKLFINVAGMGFDVDVVINTERYKQRFSGMLPYLFGIIRSMTHLKSIPVKLDADGQTIEENALLLAVANGSHFGGGMAVAPNADASDGLFDVCLIKKVSLFNFLRLLPLFIKGKHIGKKPVMYFRAKRIVLQCEAAPMQFDGELGPYAPATFEVLPGALKMMLPVS